MPRPAERLPAQPEERVSGLRTLHDLRSEKGVAAVRPNGGNGRHLHRRFESLGASGADVEVLGFERAWICRDQRDGVAETIVEIREVELRAIVRDALPDAQFDAAGSLGLQIGVAAE